MKLLLALLALALPLESPAACPLWFAKLFTAARNPQADVVLGRAGEGKLIGFIGHKAYESFQIKPEEMVYIDRESFYEAGRGRSPFQGRFIVSGKPVELPPDTNILGTTELGVWAYLTGIPRYANWNMGKKMPFRSAFAKALEIGELKEADADLSVNNPRIFRRLFEPFLRKTVRAGGHLHVNVHPEDEEFLVALAKLPEEDRAAKVARLKREYYRGKYNGDNGSLTRLELLTVASDPELYRATEFYRDYSARINPGGTLWIGPGNAP